MVPILEAPAALYGQRWAGRPGCGCDKLCAGGGLQRRDVRMGAGGGVGKEPPHTHTQGEVKLELSSVHPEK